MRTMPRVVSLALLGIALFPATAPLAASPMRPGLWELNFATNVGKQSVAGDPARECVTQKDVASETATLPRPGDCKVSNVRAVGKHTTYDLACTMDDATMNGNMELMFDAEQYSGKAEMWVKGKDAQERPVVMTISAKRIGDCTK
jgi:hypothetical protein